MVNYALPQMKYAEHKGLISIIIPVYNNEVYLIECLNSVLAQRFTNWEAILVNDGSTDNTGKIIDEYAKKNSRFIAIHKQNEGTLLARKTGLENSKGEFIANLDHDDVYNPQFLEKMYAKITETDVDFVWCKCQITNKAMYYSTDYEWNLETSANVAMMLTVAQGPTWLTWDKLIKRKIYTQIKFPDMKIIIGEDPIQMLQIAYYSKSAKFISENLYFHRLGGASSGGKSMRIIQSMIIQNKILEILFNDIVPQNVIDAFYCIMDRINISYHFFLLNEKEQGEFNDKSSPFLPKIFKKWMKNKTQIKIDYKRYEHIYIYGTGSLSERTVNLFEEKCIAVEGFIVSDGHKTMGTFKNKPIYEISHITLNKADAVILALDYENKKQVIPILKDAKINYIEI